MKNGNGINWGTFSEAYVGYEETPEISLAATVTLSAEIWTRQFQDAHQYNKESSSTCIWNAILSSRLATIVVGCTEFVAAGLNSERVVQYNTVLAQFAHRLPANIYIHLTPCFPLTRTNPQNSVVYVYNPGTIRQENGVWRTVTILAIDIARNITPMESTLLPYIWIH